MKRVLAVYAVLLFCSASFSQNKATTKADGLFDTYQYVDAINAYKELVNSNKANAYVYARLADSYYNVFNTKEAIKWYAKAVESKQAAEVYYRYAQSLKTQGQYEDANKQLAVFAKMMPNDQRAKDYLANPNYIPRLVDTDKLFDIEQHQISSRSQADFAPLLTNDGTFYFVSSRNATGKDDRTSNTSYIDIYEATLRPDGSNTAPMAIDALNTPYHDGPLTLTSDGNTMIFARDGLSGGAYKRDAKNNVKIAQQQLYIATKQNGVWGQVKSLSLNNKEYSVTHPSLSADGTTLYFSSNMPGGMGDSDIWKVSVDGDDYGKPQNLGPEVNTAGKEGFPFITDDGVLYFSSNGKQGFGGFDVFRIDLNTQDDAINLGAPVNTESDDFSFSLNTKMNTGYFASNRSGVDHIYTAIPICQLELTVMVTDSTTKAALSMASVSILDQQGNVIATQQSNANGSSSFTSECETPYVFNVALEGYENASVTVEPSKSDIVNIPIALQPIIVEVTETEVKLKPIYFEFNESFITQQGAQELDKLLSIMQKNPELSILVKSHTDSKGSTDYNLALSDRRAQATVQYLISKGIAKERLSAEGVGTEQPKIDCLSNCTEEEHAQNRRSEFLIVK